jgi:hypothetical protein
VEVPWWNVTISDNQVKEEVMRTRLLEDIFIMSTWSLR